MVITSVANSKIKEIKKMLNNKHSLLEETFLVEGEHLVDEAFKSGVLKEIIVLDGTDFNYDLNKIIVTKNVMESISTLPSSPKIIGICFYIKEKESLGNKIIVLDNVQDPGNVGAIIRSAVAFNYDTVVLSEDCAKKYNQKVIRSSQGMMFKINVITRKIDLFINEIKGYGYYVYGTNVVNGTNIKSIKSKDKYAIVLGSEGSGVNKNVQELVNENLYINMNKTCESLNVAVAGSIIMHELS
ncbi:MAG: RNA methyltransferase [Bacilli bacterium]